MTKQTTTTQTMSHTEATDEAVLLLVRRLRRLHPNALQDVMSSLPAGAQEAVHFADQRADTRRAQQGVPTETEWPTHFEAVDEEE